MVKKLLIMAVIGSLAFAALKGTRAFNYAKQEVASVGEWVDSQIPTEKKIQHLRKEVKALDKDIEKANNALAGEIVDVNRLAGEVAALRKEVGDEQKKLVSMGESIKNSQGKVAYGTTEVSPAVALHKLNADTKAAVAKKATLDSMEKTLVSRERIKDALQKQLDGLRRNKQDLSVAIDKLEAEYKVLQYEQIESKYQVDDTRLAGVKQALRDLQRDVDVQRQKLKMAPAVAEEGPPANGLSVDEILAPLTNKKSESKDD